MVASISVQLYTLRDSVGTDPGAVLGRLGAKGFVGVESAGLYELEPREFAALLDDAGLSLSSAHVGLDDSAATWLDEWSMALDAHQEAGATNVVIPALHPDRFADLDAIRHAADAVNSANAPARARGLTLGYHNHFWELRDLDGRRALEHFFDAVDPSVVAEVDIYWAQVGGADPAALVAALGDRVRLLHVKDGPADAPASDMVAVGEGAVPIGAALAAAPSAAWHIVELDRCATDMMEAVERSFDFLVGNGLSAGRS